MNRQNTPTKDPGLRGSDFPVLLKVSEAAGLLGLTTWQIRTLIRERRLGVVEVGRRFYLRRAALLKWAEGEESFARR